MFPRSALPLSVALPALFRMASSQRAKRPLSCRHLAAGATYTVLCAAIDSLLKVGGLSGHSDAEVLEGSERRRCPSKRNGDTAVST